MRNVTVLTSLHIAMDKDDWSLYDKPGAARAASNISRGVMSILNREGITPHLAAAECAKVLEKYRDFGAADTEPRVMLAGLMRLKFGGQLGDY